MAQCPKCSTELKDDYGMSQCPGCGTFSFVDMDGNANIAVAEAPAVIEEPPSEFDPISESVIDVPAGFDSFEPAPSVDLGIEVSAVGESIDIAAPAGSAADEPPAEFQSFDAFQSFDEPTADLDPQVQGVDNSVENTPSQAFGPASDPLGLNDFANSEVSSGRDGPLLYRVLISGIDTKEIRESIREVLEDSRFAWDSAEIYGRIQKGDLVIDGMSPVKASILVTRIKHLPVTIRWEQYAITQTDS